MLSFSLFHDTATTEIYTYGHTLSLHDALPILQTAMPDVPCEERLVQHVRLAMRELYAELLTRREFTNEVAARVMRSEEHTSELQSLMRISYAVFCLKKKTKT